MHALCYSCMRKDDHVNELVVCAHGEVQLGNLLVNLCSLGTRDYLRELIRAGIVSLFGIILLRVKLPTRDFLIAVQ